MGLILFPFKKARLLLGFLIVTMLVFAHGCGDDANTVVVSFSKTVSVERPEERSAGSEPLRVAVAAMVSPKETVVYYRQVLDYISRHEGEDAQLIQRKTYGETNELFGKGGVDPGDSDPAKLASYSGDDRDSGWLLGLSVGKKKKKGIGAESTFAGNCRIMSFRRYLLTPTFTVEEPIIKTIIFRAGTFLQIIFKPGLLVTLPGVRMRTRMEKRMKTAYSWT